MGKTVESKYRNAFFRCRPKHERCDEFSIRHPKMQMSQRAKIFAPYAALRGFEEVIEEKRQFYVQRRELNEEEQQRLNRTLTRLQELTPNRRTARENHVIAAVTFFVPCADEQHEAYGRRGTYETVCGMVWWVDPLLTKSLSIKDRTIDFADIAEITIQAAPD